MPSKTASARTRAKKSPKTNKTTKATRKTRQQPDSGTEEKEQPSKSTSAYFNKKQQSQPEYDSDALDEDSEAGPKKRKSSARGAKKAPVQNKKRKIEKADEDYDDGATEASSSASATAYDSDALDDDDGPTAKPKRKGRMSTNAKVSPKKTQSPRKKRKQAAGNSDEEEYDDLAEGQEVVGMVVQAPKAGRVPPGQISQNTFDFLNKLKDPECNDREWFKLHEPVYRLAEKEWKDFVDAVTDLLVEVDPQLPPLPPKDVIHRIYRDVRFSNDKTPYKRNFSASFSRSGRKGIFAGYHVSVQPGNQTLIGAGSWCPGRNELANIRTNIQRNSRRIWSVISAPEFVKFFGKPQRHPKGERQNIFGLEDELKVAPKGVPKDHKDIDLLKCRSFVVMHKFTDSEVLSPDFKESIAAVARVLQPFVHCLNDIMTIMADDDDDEGEEEATRSGHEDD